MAKKTSTKKTRISTEKKKFPIVPVVIAVIGCLGTVVAALVTGFFGYLNTRTQIDRPVIMTQTAESNQDAAQVKTKAPELIIAGFNWEDILDISHKTPCPTLVFPDYMISGTDTVTWLQENGLPYYIEQGLMYSPMEDSRVSRGYSFFIHLTITNTSREQDWIRLDKEITLSIRHAGKAPDVTHAVNVASCGGTGYMRVFSEVTFRSDFDRYDSKAVSTDVDFYTLEPGEFEVFQMHFACENPGIYQVQFNIPITYQGKDGMITYTGVEGFVCPDKMNFYLSDYSFENEQELLVYDVKNYEWTGSGFRESLP